MEMGEHHKILGLWLSYADFAAATPPVQTMATTTRRATEIQQEMETQST